MAANKILLKDKLGNVLLPFTKSQLVEVGSAIKAWSDNLQTVDDALAYVKTWQEAQDKNLGDFVDVFTEWVGADSETSYTKADVATGDSVEGKYTWDNATSSYVAASGDAVDGTDYYTASETAATGIYDTINDKIAAAIAESKSADVDVDSISYDGKSLTGAVTLAADGGTSISVDETSKTVTISSAESKTKNDVIVAGGPLADDVLSDSWPSTWYDDDNNKIIPSGVTIEDLIKGLFLQEKYGSLTGPVYSWTAKLNNNPSADIKSGTKSVDGTSVPVGTSVTVTFGTSSGTTNSATATVDGATYGYSLDGSTIASTATSYTQTATGGSISGTLAIKSATFQGSDVSAQTADTEYIVKSGSNSLVVSQDGLSATAPTFAGATVYNVSNTKTVKASDSKTISESGFEASTAYTGKGNPYTLPATSTTKTVTGYYPAFYGWLTDTSATINDDYITEHFADTLKAKLTQGSSAAAPTSTNMPVGVATIIVAVKGSTKTTMSVVDSKGSVAGTSHYVDITLPNAADTPTYRVFYITNASGSGATNTFTVSFS